MGGFLMKKFVLTCAVALTLGVPAFAADTAYQAMVDGKWSQAETLLRQGLAQNPNDTSRMLNLAFVLQNSGKQAEAAAIYQKVLQLDSNPLVAVDDPYVLSRPERAKQVARKGMASIENSSTKR